MESKALQRLEDGLRRLVAQHGQASTRSGQLAAALAKSREEIEKLKAQNFRFKTERAETRKKIDAVVRRLDRMADGQGNEAGD
jgi:septal ring factor EnvC (AmiA/AmiB activator)